VTSPDAEDSALCCEALGGRNRWRWSTGKGSHRPYRRRSDAIVHSDYTIDPPGRERQEETGWAIDLHDLLGLYSDPATQTHRYPKGRACTALAPSF
jgi:hypothetical protein